jgi:glycosyltransferase involved in cell wall biosynthesis
MIQLSITIPSYNRHKELQATLDALYVNAFPSSVEILIIDNHSQPALRESLATRYADCAPAPQWIRNPANIGLAGNLLRCFEAAQGEWIWLLGDDDAPLADAVSGILKAIEAAESGTALLKFNSSNGGEVAEDTVLTNMAQLSERCSSAGFYSNLLFISSGVFRRTAYLPHLASGYHWAYSLAPHLAMTFNVLASGKSILLVPRHLVNHGLQQAVDNWNHFRLTAGFTSLADQEQSADFVKLAMPFLGYRYLRHRMIRRMGSRFLADSERSPRQWLFYYLRYAAIIGGGKGLLMTLAAWSLCLLGKVQAVRRIAETVKTPTTSIGNLDRS